MARTLALILILVCGCDRTTSTSGAPKAMSEEKKLAVNEFWAVYRPADAAFRQERYSDAIPLYRDALVLRPGHEASLNHLATCYLATGDHAAAVASLEALVAHDAMSSRGHARLGTLHSSPDDEAHIDLDRAAVHFERMLALNRENSGPHFQLGRIALYRGDLDRAIASLRHAQQFDAGGVAVGRHLARALVLDGDRVAAATVLVGVLKTGLARSSPEGMTAEGETRADRELRSLYSSRYIVVLEDLRRLGEWTVAAEYREPAAGLEFGWPGWRPERVSMIEGVIEGRREAVRTVETDLDGDGRLERLVGEEGSFEEALIARARSERSAEVAPTFRIERREGSDWIDVTSEWIDGSTRLALPIACLAVADFDGDDRLDVLIGCGSADPLDVHLDVVLRQLEPGRLVPHRLEVGERGTRAVTATGDLWILHRSSAFPAADGTPGSGWRLR